MIVSALSSRYIPTWTPDDYEAAIIAADGGSLAHAADFTLAIMQDDRVRGVLSTRTLGMLGLPLSWEPAPAPAGWYRLATEAEQARLLSWGLMLGVGFAKVTPWGSLDVWHPRWFRQDESTRQWYAQTRNQGEVAVTPGNGWVIYTPYGEREPWHYGQWISLAVPFLAKRFAIHDRARASEVFGSAMVVGTAPEGATEDKRQKFLADLRQLARSARIVLPPGYDVDLKEAQGQTWGIYDQSITWADDAITVSLAGQKVTTDGQKGFSRGDIHERIAQSLVRFGAETFSTCLGTQYVPQVWGVVKYPHWDVDPPGDRLRSVSESLTSFGGAVEATNRALEPYSKRVNVAAYVKDFDEIKLMPILPPAGETLAAEVEQQQSEGPDYPAQLAAKLSAAGVDRCRHGSVNRCRICKIERDEDFAIDPTGATVWAVKWRPIAQRRSAAPTAGQRLYAQSVKRDPVYGPPQPLGDEPPTEFRIFAAGPNPVDSGDDLVWFTPRSAELVMAVMGDRDLMIDLEHRSLSGADPDARGGGRLEVRNGELWASTVKWAPDGDLRIREKRQRSISPTFLTDENGEIVEVINCALTALPAMPFAPRLVAARRKVQNNMDPKLLEMLGLPPDATIEQVLEAVAAMKMVAMKQDPAPAPAPQAAPPAPAPVPPQAAAPVAAPVVAQSLDTSAAANAVIQSMAAELASIRTRQDNDERRTLLTNAALSPVERQWLATQPLESVRTFVQSVVSARGEGPQQPGATPGPAASIDAVAKATGMSRDYVRAGLDNR